MLRPELILSGILMIVGGAGYHAVLAQNCRLSGSVAWNPALRDVIADCPGKFVSPNGQVALRIAPDGSMSLWKESRVEKLLWKGCIAQVDEDFIGDTCRLRRTRRLQRMSAGPGLITDRT